MPCFSGEVVNGQPLCDVLIFPDELAPSQNASSLSFEETIRFLRDDKHSYRALIDTGSTGCCISERVVENLELISEGKTPINNTTGEHLINEYSVLIYIPIRGVEQISSLTPFNRSVTEIRTVSTSTFDVILGMDIINIGSLIIGGGRFRFCY